MTLHLETNFTGMGHFQVSKTLVVKLQRKAIILKAVFYFYLYENKNLFSDQRLCNYPQIKQRFGTTWQGCLYLTYMLVVVFE